MSVAALDNLRSTKEGEAVSLGRHTSAEAAASPEEEELFYREDLGEVKENHRKVLGDLKEQLADTEEHVKAVTDKLQAEKMKRIEAEAMARASTPLRPAESPATPARGTPGGEDGPPSGGGKVNVDSLLAENTKLKRENAQLKEEIDRLRGEPKNKEGKGGGKRNRLLTPLSAFGNRLRSARSPFHKKKKTTDGASGEETRQEASWREVGLSDLPNAPPEFKESDGEGETEQLTEQLATTNLYPDGLPEDDAIKEAFLKLQGVREEGEKFIQTIIRKKLQEATDEISRKWFFEIGGYDSSMKGWGGENLDQSLRIWTCGGEIVSAPESYVAHMWRDGTAKTKAKYKLGAGDAIKNRARAVKAHLGRWYEKTLTFPSFKQWRGKELDTSSITDAFSQLKCENFEWYLNRFKNIYRNAGVVPIEVFQVEAVSSVSSDPLCLELKQMRWTNYGSADEIVLRKCTGSSPTEPKAIWWHKSNRLKDGSCCGSLRAWNTDQCVDGRNPQLGAKRLKSYTCDLDSGLEAYLQSDDGDELLMKVGRGDKPKCISVEGGSSLKVVECVSASKWRKRHAFTPIEYELLSSDTKSDWEKES